MIPLPKNVCVGGYSGASKDLSRKRSAKMIDRTEKTQNMQNAERNTTNFAVSVDSVNHV